MKLRSYQSDAATAVLKKWTEFQSVITVVATGGGKTVIAGGIADSTLKKGGRVLYLANRDELCFQPVEAFRAMTGIVPDFEKAERKASLASELVIGSIQTMSRKARLERFAPDHFTHIMADECHMSVAPSWKRVFAYFSKAKLCGFTATPFRSDAKKLTDIFEAEAYRKDLFALVDDGWLVDPDHVDRLSVPISLKDVRTVRTAEGVDYDVNDVSEAIGPYFEAIAGELKAKHAQRHILAFLPLIATSQKFVARCQAAGLNAVHIDGEDPLRGEKLQAFKEGKIQLLSNANLLHTGVDMPCCDATLNLRPTKSKVLYAQIVGRSTRTVPGLVDEIESIADRKLAIATSSKPRAYIIDPLWMSADHDLVTPAFLIAKDQDEAVAINKRAGDSYSLRGVQSDIQAEKEAAIRRRLLDVARFRSASVHYRWFAAATGEHALLSYEPIFPSEKRPPSSSRLAYLASAGISSQDISSAGLLGEILKAVGRRRFKRLAEISDLACCVRSEEDITPELWTLTKKEVDAKIRSYA